MCFQLQTVFYCEEMMRLRVERVKEMLLLSGVPRQSFWASYFISHLVFFMVPTPDHISVESEKPVFQGHLKCHKNGFDP